jgi:hypothetical protein
VTHPFHSGRYSGANTIPDTARPPVPAAALVAHHDRMVPVDPMFRALDAYPGVRPVREARLVPVQAVDFYAREQR